MKKETQKQKNITQYYLLGLLLVGGQEKTDGMGHGWSQEIGNIL